MKQGLKKLLLVLIVAALSFSSVSANAEIGYSDIEGNDVLKQANMLMALGIMYPDNDGSFAGEKLMTRAEAAVAIIRFMGYENMTIPTEAAAESIFDDVADDFWAVEDINLAYMFGIISKNPENCFRPSDNVTIAEFTKMLMTALGYSYEAEAQGGYPTGYMLVAGTQDVSDGVTTNYEAAAKRKDVAIMLYNALTANVREIVSINGDVQYLEERASAMEVFLHLTLARGVVNVSGDVYLAGYSSVGEDYALIGSDLLKISDYSAEKYVGEYVEYCYKDESGVKELKYIIPVENANDKITITPATDFSYDPQQRTYTVFEGKSKKYQLKYDFDVIYNGELDLTRGDMAPDNSIIELIDNNNDRTYDVVRITAYKNYIAVSYDPDLNSLNCMGGKLLSFNDVEKLRLYKNDVVIGLSDINPGDVVSVSQAKSGESLTIFVNSKKVIGKFEYSSTDSDRYVTFDGIEYQVAEDIYCENNVDISENLSGTLYFDFADRVAGFISDSNIMSMGYLVKAAAADKGIKKTVQARIFTTENQFKVYNFAEKVEVNGKKLKPNESEFATMLSGTAGSNLYDVPAQLIRYDIDRDGNINCMKTATPDNPALGELKVEQNKTQTFMTGGQTMGGKYYVGNCGVFVVPFDVSMEDKYSYTTTVYLTNKKEYTFDAYTFDEDLTTDAIVCKSPSLASLNSISKSRSLVMVSKIRVTSNADGETILKLEAYLSGKPVSYYIKDEMFMKTAMTLKKGDIVQVASSAEYVTGFRKIYDSVHNEGMLTEISTAAIDSNAILCGHITKLEGTVFKFVPANCDYSGITSDIYDYSVSTTYADYGKLSEPANDSSAQIYNMSTLIHVFERSGIEGERIYTISQNQLSNLMNTDGGKKYFIVMRLSEGSTKDIFVYID